MNGKAQQVYQTITEIQRSSSHIIDALSSEKFQPDKNQRADHVCGFGTMIGEILPSRCSRRRSL